MGKRATPEVRFARQYAVQPNGCWLWTGGLTQGGFSSFTICTGLTVSGHRYAYEQRYGAIKDGYRIRHLCRHHHCVNPQHLIALPNYSMALVDMPYPRTRERARAERMLNWLSLKFPPWLAEIEGMQRRLADYHHRRSGWTVSDFD